MSIFPTPGSLSGLDIVAHVHDEIILEAPPELTGNLEMLLKARKPCRMNDIAYRICARKDFWGLVVNGTGLSLSRHFKKTIKKYCCAWNMPIKKLL